MNNKITSLNAYKLILISVYFIFSLVILNYYSLGDREVYNNLYNAISSQDALSSLANYRLSLGTNEIGWFLVFYPFSLLGVDRNIISSLLIIFVFTIYINKYCNSKKRLFFITVQFLCNIQILSVLFASERFFLAIIFFICIMVLNSKSLLLLMPVFHIPGSFYAFIYFIYMFISSKIHVVYFSILIFILPIFFFINLDYILIKIYAYQDRFINYNFIYFFKAIVLSAISMLYLPKTKLYIIIPILFVFLSLLIPNERTFQLFYLWFFHIIFNSNRQYALSLIFLLSIPFMFNGLQFILGVFERGNGLDPLNFVNIL